MQRIYRGEEALGTAAAGVRLDDRFELLERVGAGGMATIYRARDTLLDRDVAVKVLHPHLADDPTVLARFRTEARHAAALTHPHIVGVFDQGHDGLPYIVMEHVDGPSLRDILNERGRLTPREALAVVEPVCAALHRAHAAGVVHRDVKPENVLVTPDGVPKVADFGIARALAATNVTQTGMLIGSVHYLAPELVAGAEATPASDQYAVGVLLFELLTGRKALPAETAMAVALRHGREAIPAPSEFAPDIAPAVDAVVARATALDPGARFATLDELVSAAREAVPEGPEALVVSRRTPDGQERTLVIPAEHVDDAAEPAGDATAAVPIAAGEDGLHTPAAQRRPRRRVLRALLALLGALVLIGVLATAGLATWHYVIAPVQQVPSLHGVAEDAARRQLAGLGLMFEVTTREHSRVVAEGAVLEQDQPAGTELRRGELVAVVVSAGPAFVEMPDVQGRSLAEAERILTGEPYFFAIARVDRAHHDTVPADHVIAQRPDRGTELRQDDEVILQVSLGIEQVRVPDVSAMTRVEADAAVREEGLVPVFAPDEYSDAVPRAGLVFRQSLEPGTEVDKGSSVTLTVSRGALTLRLDDYRGQSVETAAAALRALDLEVRVIEQERPRIGPFRRGVFGQVEEQDPVAGTHVRRGQRVDLYTFAPDEEADD